MSAGHEDLIDYDEENIVDEPKKLRRGSRRVVKEKETKKSQKNIHSTGFKDFLLRSELMKAITDCGFEHPSEVQQKCIPQAVLGGDVLCQAKSGMGKTAVFSIVVLNQIQAVKGEVSAVVLCHTRELAYQIKNEFSRFSKHMAEIKTEVFYGGVGIRENEERLLTEQPNIIVGTPGRVLALIRTKKLSLSKVKFFVLDECDKMLSTLEMRQDVQEIFLATPKKKQTMMFTATLSKELRPVCKKFMNMPLEIYVDDETKLTLHGLQQHYVGLKENEKTRKLKDLIDKIEFNQVAVFVKSVQRAKELSRILEQNKFPTLTIHSGMKQDERISAYKEFKEFKKRILVATDVFGRGMDVERINVVFNYDMPDSADSYLHRVGRAGRFGTKGLSITFVSTEEDRAVLKQVEERFEVSIPELPDAIEKSSYMNS